MNISHGQVTNSNAPKMKQRKYNVRFLGAQYIEFDAQLPPVVRVAGVGRDDMLYDKCSKNFKLSIQLEYKARKLQPELKEHDLIAESAYSSILEQLKAEYVNEIKSKLTIFDIMPCSNDLLELWIQLQLLEFVLTAFHGQKDGVILDTFLSQLSTTSVHLLSIKLRVMQLHLYLKDNMTKFTTTGYVFGRRFLTISEYLSILELVDLKELATNHNIEEPMIDTSKIQIPNRCLLVKRPFSPLTIGTIPGIQVYRSLQKLTLRELLEEAKDRGILRCDDGKISIQDNKKLQKKITKKYLVDLLKPLVHDEVLKDIVQEKQKKALRDSLYHVLKNEIQTQQMCYINQLLSDYCK